MTATEAKKKPAESKTARSGRNFNFWADQDLADAFQKFVDSLEYESTFTGLFEKAIKEFLEKRGFWPPKP